jgi:hypothetical protein
MSFRPGTGAETSASRVFPLPLLVSPVCRVCSGPCLCLDASDELVLPPAEPAARPGIVVHVWLVPLWLWPMLEPEAFKAREPLVS